MTKAQTLTSEAAQAAAKTAREALYVTVGLGVLGFQRAQVRRVDLQRRLAANKGLESSLAGARQAVTVGRERLGGLVEEASRAAGSTLGPIEEQLPKAARQVAHRAQDGARQLGGQLRHLVNR